MLQGAAVPLDRRRAWRPLATGALSAVLVLGSAPAAGAHEVGLVVVAERGSPAEDAVDGFRLAVEQSPDVSHAPGADAGDHLGGVDVDVMVVRRGRRVADAGRRVTRAVSSSARVVVVLTPGAGSMEIVPRIRVPGTLIVVAGTRSALPEELALPVVLLGTRPVGRLERASATRFERAFARRYGRAPGRTERRGYAAGRLVDRTMARLGEGPFAEPALTRAIARADRALVGATARVVPAIRRGDEAGVTAPVRSTSRTPVAVTLTMAGLLVGLLVLRLSRRRRRSPIPR